MKKELFNKGIKCFSFLTNLWVFDDINKLHYATMPKNFNYNWNKKYQIKRKYYISYQ